MRKSPDQPTPAIDVGTSRDSTPGDEFPAKLDRDYEERLVELSVSDDLDPQRWLEMGPRFFMAGLAVMLASAGDDGRRPRLLKLAEGLYPGASEVSVFGRWLECSPLRPTRFFPLVDAARRTPER